MYIYIYIIYIYIYIYIYINNIHIIYNVIYIYHYFKNKILNTTPWVGMDQTTNNITRKSKWRWTGRTVRNPPETITHHANTWKPQGRGKEEGLLVRTYCKRDNRNGTDQERRIKWPQTDTLNRRNRHGK